MKYFWLKLDKNFFQQHDIRMIESFKNGKEMLLFYIKLLAESVSHDGNLRFSDEIAYDNEMLAGITNTDISIVEDAMKHFIRLKLLEIGDDGTITMTQVKNMVGKDDSEKVSNRERQRRYRERHNNEDNVTECYEGVTEALQSNDRDKSKEIRDKNIYKSVCKRNVTFTPPTLEEVKAYCHERGDKVDAQKFFDYFEAGKWHDSEGKPVKNWKQKVITWEKHAKSTTPNYKKGTFFQMQERNDYDFDVIDKIMEGQ